MDVFLAMHVHVELQVEWEHVQVEHLMHLHVEWEHVLIYLASKLEVLYEVIGDIIMLPKFLLLRA